MKIKEFYTKLIRHYGPQGWWPAESRLECIIGAILTQNTSWKNVEKALKNLKNNDLINFNNLLRISLPELAEIIRPSGYYNLKATRLKNFVEFIKENYDSKIENMLNEKTTVIRKKLLLINGIGSETADTIILYALEKPVFVVDRYTYRIFNRHHLITEKTSYEDIQKLFTDSIEQKTQIYNEFHALIVRLGKDHCKKSPKCSGCPLEYDLEGFRTHACPEQG